MPTFFNPTSVTFAGNAITTVTSIGYNINKTSGNSSGDGDAYAAGWIGAGIITASIQMGDIAQAQALEEGTQNVTLAWTAAAAANATDKSTTIVNMTVKDVVANNPHNANSSCTVNLHYTGAGGASSPIS